MPVVNLATYKATAPASRLPDSVDAPLPQAPGRYSRRVTIDLIRTLDALAIMAGALLPAALASDGAFADIDWVMYARSAVVAGTVAAVLLSLQGHYRAAELPDLADRPAGLLIAIAIALAAVAALGLPASIPSGALHTWAMAWLAAAFTLTLSGRAVARTVLRRVAAEGRFARRVAIYGAGAIGRRIHDELSDWPGIRVVGLFDDRGTADRVPKDGLVAIGRTADLCQMARAGDIDDIVIAVPPTAEGRVAEIARRFEQLPADIRIATHITSDFVEDGLRPAVSALGPVGALDIKQKALADWGTVVKRAEDLVLGLLLLAIALPLFPLIALAIKLDSTGPVLFRQRRRGLNQRIVNVLKFRTMTVMEDSGEVRQAVARDPRITRVGRFLRRSSLDELPQLLNVIRGEMSLVGPRPHALVHDEHYGQLIETYANRHQVKPGITGLAQVRGHRGETSTADKMQVRIDSDLTYIKTWSLALDLRILFATIWAVMLQKNAF